MLPPHVAKAAETLKASKVILDDMYKHKQEYSAVDLSWRCLDILRVLNSTMISLVEEDLEDEDQMPDEEEKEKMPDKGDGRLFPQDPKSEEKSDQSPEDFFKDSVVTVREPDEEPDEISEDTPTPPPDEESEDDEDSDQDEISDQDEDDFSEEEEEEDEEG